MSLPLCESGAGDHAETGGHSLRWDIDFEPIGRRGPSRADATLLEAARDLGIDLINLCGGEGRCGRCRVQPTAGELSPVTDIEQELLSPHELHQGFRLACQAYPKSDVTLHVPSESLSTQRWRPAFSSIGRYR